MSDSPGDLYLKYRAIIEAVIRSVCRHRGIPANDWDDFAGDVRLALLDPVANVLGQFGGRSKIQTYVTVVVQREAIEYLRRKWGRWRPAEPVKQEGPAAIRLQELVVRDGRPLQAALDIVLHEFREADRASLEALAQTFTARLQRRNLGEELLLDVVSGGADPEQTLLTKEAAERLGHLIAAMLRAVETLDPSEQLLLKYRYQHRMKVSDIARLMKEDPKRLYRKLDDIRARLRAALEAEGIDTETVRRILKDSDPPAGAGS